MGVLYHLRHPLLALDLIREHVAGDMLIFQTLQRGSYEVAEVPEDHPFFIPGTTTPPAYFDEPGYPKMHFIERSYANDWTNWWAPNRACAEAMLRAAGFSIETRVKDDDGIYICRRAEMPYGQWQKTGAVYPAKGNVTE
jgi:tRNA (mo5U34)-methyltransferase